MKQTLLLICLLGILTTTKAQGYQSFFGENKTTWHVFVHRPCYTNEDTNPTQLGSGDTYKFKNSIEDTETINGTSYFNIKLCLIDADNGVGQIYFVLWCKRSLYDAYFS